MTGVVEIAPCPDDRDARCGAVIWVWSQPDWPHAAPGDLVLRDLERGAEGWSGGSLLHPETGLAFTGRAMRRGADFLTLEGCALFLCEEATWRSVASLGALNAIIALHRAE